MARRKNKKSAAGALIAVLCVIGIILVFAFGTQGDFISNLKQIWNNTISYGHSSSAQSVSSLVAPEDSDKLLLYVMDTGNSDSMVLRTPDGHAILIDAADNDDSQQILDTLHLLGIEKLDGVVATHPHADHIGSMAAVLSGVPVSTIYMTDFTATTKTYESMIDVIEQKDIHAVNVTAGYQFSVGGVHFTALNPQNKGYGDANNSSIVLLAQYGDTKFLFEGDAEKAAISDMLSNYSDQMDIDVLKVGHHGSSNATTQAFLDVTTPQLAIITCGKDNDYGHPHTETIDMLGGMQIPILRTDQNGDIAVFTDGSTITYKTAA